MELFFLPALILAGCRVRFDDGPRPRWYIMHVCVATPKSASTRPRRGARTLFFFFSFFLPSLLLLHSDEFKRVTLDFKWRVASEN